MVFDDNGASVLEWYQMNFVPEIPIPELLKMASVTEPGCNGLLARPCANVYKDLNGFENKSSIHQHNHFVRAILESTAFSLKEIIEKLSDLKRSFEIVSTGGGARSRLWTKIKSDMTGKRFILPECNESACLGAAMIGAIGIGRFGNLEEVTEKWLRYKEIIDPDLSTYNMYLSSIGSRKKS